MSESLAQAVYALLIWLGELAMFDFPGTSIPICVVMLSPLAMYIIWRFTIKKIFGVDD